MDKRYFNWPLLFLLCCILSSCGEDSTPEPGSPSSNDATDVSPPPDDTTDASPPTPAANTKPVADAGRNINRSKGQNVKLDGNNSYDDEGDALIYTWNIVDLPIGSSSTLSNPAISNPDFVPDTYGTYTFSLTVNDAEFTSDPDTVLITVDSTLIYSNEFEQMSITDFTVTENGTAQVYLFDGQLRIDPGENSFLDNGFISLDLATLAPIYSSILNNNISSIIWSFNASNINGPVCGVCNNGFDFVLSSEPTYNGSTLFGYALGAGSMVGDRMVFWQVARWASIFGVQTINMMDINDGLSNMPIKGAFKMIFDPSTSEWQLFFEQDLIAPDTQSLTTLVATSINNAYTSEDLRYLVFNSIYTGSSYFDNLTISYR